MKWLRWAVFFFFNSCKQNYQQLLYQLIWCKSYTGDWLYLSLRWFISYKTPGTGPGLCEPFHSCLFEVYYLSQTTKFRPFNVNEALWLSGSGRPLLQSLFSSQSEQLLNVVAPLCYTCKDKTTQAGELNIGSVAQDKTETCTQSMHEIDYVQLSVLPFNVGPV